MTNLPVSLWVDQSATWPTEGRHVLACYDETSVVVYQAYRASIADYAIANQRFGCDFSLQRMSWIKPGFLWIMHRSGWATKPNQERILAMRLPRSAFDLIMQAAVPSTYDPQVYSGQEEWRSALQQSEVRVQWDPDHDPYGRPLKRRAIQLGIRGTILRRYALDLPVAINDITDFVQRQRERVKHHSLGDLEIPVERVYAIRPS